MTGKWLTLEQAAAHPGMSPRGWIHAEKVRAELYRLSPLGRLRSVPERLRTYARIRGAFDLGIAEATSVRA